MGCQIERADAEVLETSFLEDYGWVKRNLISKETEFEPGHMRIAASAPGVTRTPGQRFRKPLLYPPELRGRIRTRKFNCSPLDRKRKLEIFLSRQHVNPLDMRAIRSASDGLSKLVELCLVAGRGDLYASIGRIRNPP